MLDQNHRQEFIYVVPRALLSSYGVQRQPGLDQDLEYQDPHLGQGI